jgi:hypothetical protein
MAAPRLEFGRERQAYPVSILEISSPVRVPATKATALPAPSPAPALAALCAGVLAAFAPQIFSDGDTFTHVAAGLRMLDAHALLQVDPFSATFAGRPWHTHEWLSEIVMAMAWRAGGFSGVALLIALAAAATAGLLTRHVGRWMGGPALAAVLALGLASLAPTVLARPHLLALPFLEMWAAELIIARSEGRMPSWRRLLPIALVWSNLHGSFLFGLALLGAFGLEDLIVRRGEPRAALGWAGLGLAAAAAACISPHGIDNLLFPLRLLDMRTLKGIGEWSPMVPARQAPFVVALFAGVLALVRTRARVELTPLLLLLLLVWLAFAQVRQLLLFGVLAPLLIAEPLGLALRPPAVPPAWGRAAVLAALPLALAAAALRLAEPVRLLDGPAVPIAALAHVPASIRSEPVFDAARYGGFLILKGVRPYIDSRAELYGDAFRADYLRMASGDACRLGRELQARRIGWTLLEPGSTMAAVLDAAAGWRRLYADRFAVVHVRTTGALNACPKHD